MLEPLHATDPDVKDVRGIDGLLLLYVIISRLLK